MKIKIITDSTNDLGRDLLEQLNIDVIPLTVNFDEESYLDSVEITTKELYEKVEAKGQLPKTAAVPIQKFIDVFEKYINEGYEIVYTGISKLLSRTFENAYFAAQEVNPEKIHLVDSMNLSTGIGLQVLKACELVEKQMDRAQIESEINRIIPFVRASFVVDTLTYLHRGGRCSATAAFFGNALKLKPKIVVENGKMDAANKYRGLAKKVILNYVKDMEEKIKTADPSRIFITHSGCEQEIIDSVYNYLKEMNYFKEIYITRAGGVISSHCGYGTLGVLFIEKDK